MKTYIVVDLGFGDAGKGTTIDYLSRLTPNTLIVRYNGGPQAGHNVVTPDGRHHCFAQFSSGTIVPTVRTYLSKYMWVEPLALLAENESLEKIGVRNALSRVMIDMETRVITPFHKVANRARERVNRHGSCGMGMGNAVEDHLEGLTLTIEDLYYRHEGSLNILEMIQEKKREEVGRLHFSSVAPALDDEVVLHDPQAPRLCYDIYRYLLDKVVVVDGGLKEINPSCDFEQLIFEGACGILLDENYGFHPHTMWTTTTTEYAKRMWTEEATTLGIIRTYSTRHGNGPFVSEEKTPYDDPYNPTNEWQGSFRTGAFDLVATKYALNANGGVDALVVTHLDEPYPRMCDAYVGAADYFYDVRTGELILPTNREEQQRLTDGLFTCSPHTIELGTPFTKEIGDRLSLPILIESFGPRSCDKR